MRILVTVLGYLLGAIPSAYLITRWIKGVDIRNLGTGNPGTANVYRTVGLGAAIPVGVLDIGKGAAPVLLARAAGLSEEWALAAVVARAGEMIPRVNLVVTMDTLEYLYRGGRIGRAAQLMGSALQFKPILSLGNGVVDALERPRTQAKAVRHILEIMAARVGERLVHAAVVHADAFDKAERLRQKVASLFNCRELYVTDLTPVMGTHAGPGVLGMAWWGEESVS